MKCEKLMKELYYSIEKSHREGETKLIAWKKCREAIDECGRRLIIRSSELTTYTIGLLCMYCLTTM